MPKENEWNAVYQYTKKRIDALSAEPNEAKAALAELRRGLGKAPGEEPRLWGAFLSELPPELYGRNGEPGKGEWAVYTALTLFALHRQGDRSGAGPVNQTGFGLGRSVAGLVAYDKSDKLDKRDDNSWERIQRRFIITASSSDIRELAHRLRALVRLLRDEGLPLDYPALAKELYLWQMPQTTEKIKLKWAEDFYRNSPSTRNAKEEAQ